MGVTRFALDPASGPTAYVEIEDVPDTDRAYVSLLLGPDPDNPIDDVRLSKREFERAAQAVDRTLEETDLTAS